MVAGRRRAQLAGRDRLRRRRRHRPDRRLPRAPLARRVPLRQDRRPARRPADDRRRRDPARRLRPAALGGPRRDRRARPAAPRRLARPRAARDRPRREPARQGRDVAPLRRDRLPDRHARPHELAALALLDRPRAARSSRRCSTCATPGKSCSDEGRRHGGRRGHAPSPAHVEPAEADGADRRQAVHGAHPRAAEAARLRGRDRHRRVPAAGDPLVLRRRRDARHRHRVLGRGVAARHRRLGAARRGPARRHVPRHLRRRALRRRPDEARRVPPREGGVGDDRPQVGRQPARVRDRRHRRGRPHRALPREAVVGPGLLRHDQHRHLRARAGGAAAHPDRPAVRLLEGALPAAARDGPADVRLRHGRLLAGHRQPRPVPAGELRRARRDACGSNIPGIRIRGNVWVGEGVDLHDLDAIEGPGVPRQLLPHRARRVGRAVLGARRRA